MNLEGVSWLKQILPVASLAGLRRSVAEVIERLGFQYFLYHGHFPQGATRPNEISIDNYPEGWRRHCLRRGIDDKFEPLRRRVQKQVSPILWREIPRRHRAIFDQAREFGLVTGVTQLVHGPGGQWSSISFIKNRGGRAVEREILATLPECQLLTCYVHDTAKRIVKHKLDLAIPTRPDPSQTGGLSTRERACLMLAATGKTTSEIAEILPISERTVTYHLCNARQKLGATNSRHAVSKAISLGLIAAG